MLHRENPGDNELGTQKNRCDDNIREDLKAYCSM
jgi:hypothetical protein